ncbi:hypothetical protein EDB81DRAFT_873555 [Dactylonectria macrodidyma]|uniref:DUF6570 domain-containing protein n=1 Tax=Dactylonectria macrodidyma TaxID=307937 RepID=A0A9P9D5X6_9HYPO|nr:hypothetical protein EDB81DRAFT_873555 [Dactylonectria macrodidyma]
MDSPAAKPHEAVAHLGGWSLSAGNGQEGKIASLWEREQGDETTGGGVDVVAAAEKEPSARGKRLGRLSTYDSLANAASTFRQIQPKQSAVEDTAWRQHAEAIVRRQVKRNCNNSRDEPPRKQIRAGIRRQRRRELQAEDLASVLRFLEDEFAVKESLSNEQTWCTPVPHERKVSTVRDFYQAFHDASTLPIRTCMLCYRRPLAIFMSKLLSRGRIYLRLCGVYALPEAGWPVASGPTSRPPWLYSIPGGQRQSLRYPRHVKGHITVFPNNVQELATKVLPHPLLQVMDEIHVSWQGAEKPGPSDLSSLLSVRRRVVERALVWLKKNNPHYAEIEIDASEMESHETDQ